MPPSKGRAKPRGTVEETHRRNEQVVALRASGRTWSEVATEVDVDVRTAQRAFADYAATAQEDGRFDVLVVEALDGLDVALSHAWQIFHKASARNANVRLGALKLVTNVGRIKLSFVGASGRMRAPLRDVEMERARLRALTEQAAALLLESLDLAGVDPDQRERMLADYGLSDVQPTGEYDEMRNPSWLRTDTSNDHSAMLEEMRVRHPERFPTTEEDE